MKNAIDFVRFALSHAKRETIPAGAQIPLDIEECGTSPWEYLFGTTGNIVTQDLLNRRFSEYYSKRGWTRERFDRATENWAARRVTVCDCQGLLDVFVGVDVNAHYCYGPHSLVLSPLQQLPSLRFGACSLIYSVLH